MKKNQIKNLIAVLAIGFFVIPFFAKADDSSSYLSTPPSSNSSVTLSSFLNPTITGTVNVVNEGISDVAQTQAAVSVSFDSNNASYSITEAPAIYVQYTNEATNQTSVTAQATEMPGARPETFWLTNLTAGTNYSYQVVTDFNGGQTFTPPQTFTTQAAPVATQTWQQASVSATNAVTEPSSADLSNPVTPSAPLATTTTINPTTSNQVASATPTTVATSSALTTVANAIGVSSAESDITNDIATGGVTHSNGIILAITDGHARVYQGDTVTFTVEAQNTHDYDINDSQVSVQLPDQYQFDSSSTDANYDDHANTVTYEFGRIPSGETKTFTFTADAVGDGSGTVQTTATLQYDGGQLSATDHDAYESGSKSVLGASVFGAGFFPQTFTGWFLILLLIAIIIIVARRYVKAPKPAPQPVHVQVPTQPHPVA